MIFFQTPPALVQTQQKPSVKQESSGNNSPNVSTGNNSPVNIVINPEEQTRKEISRIGQQVVVAVRLGRFSPNTGPDLPMGHRLASGVIVRGSGVVISCPMGEVGNALGLIIETIGPPLPGDLIAEGPQLVERPVDRHLEKTDFSILYAPMLNAATSESFGQDTEQGRLVYKELHQSASLTPILPESGDKAYVVAVETSDQFPRLTTLDGTIASVGSEGGLNARIFARFPYSESYCGAPVFNGNKEVIGIVLGESRTQGEIVILPSLYLRRALRGVTFLPGPPAGHP